MGETQIIELAHRAIYMAAVITIPILLICLIVGLIVSMFETATQIHEQALTFVSKMVAVIALIAIMGGWIVSQLEGFIHEVFRAISQL